MPEDTAPTQDLEPLETEPMGPPRDALDEPERAPFRWDPLYDKLLVRRHKPKAAYDGSGQIAVAEVHQQAQNSGVVVAVGHGRLNLQYGTTIPLRVTVGMEVLFGKHSGVDMEDDPELVMLREDEILGCRWPAPQAPGPFPGEMT